MLNGHGNPLGALNAATNTLGCLSAPTNTDRERECVKRSPPNFLYSELHELRNALSQGLGTNPASPGNCCWPWKRAIGPLPAERPSVVGQVGEQPFYAPQEANLQTVILVVVSCYEIGP